MAVRFDAATDRISYLGATPPPDPHTAITITAWVYLSVDRNDFSTFLRLWTSGLSTTGTWITTATGTTLQYATGSGNNTPGYELPVGAWSRIAVTISGTSCTGYGAAATGSVTSSTTSVNGNLNPVKFTLGGRDTSDATEWLNGRLAYVRIWSSVLTSSEILAEWASPTPVKTSNLWADYWLSTASDLLDHSGNGRHLTAGSTAVTTEADPPISTPPVVGTFASSLPALTAALAGGTQVSGTLTASAPGLTAANAGIVADTGTFAGNLPALGAAFAGGESIAGTLAAGLPDLAAALAGDVTDAGTVAGGLPELAAALAGEVVEPGTLAGVLPELGATLAGQVITAGTVAADLPELAASLAGDVFTGGALAGDLPELAAALAGEVVDAGQLAATLPEFELAMAGEQTTDGTLTGTFPALSLSMSGATGSGSGVLIGELPGLAAHIAADVLVGGSVGAALPLLSLSLSGFLSAPVTGVLTATLPGLVMTSGRDDWPPAVGASEEVSAVAVSRPEELVNIAVA